MFAKSVILTTLLVGFLVSALHGGCDDSAFSILSTAKKAVPVFCDQTSCDLACVDTQGSINDCGDGMHHSEVPENCQCSCHIPLISGETLSPEVNRSLHVWQRFTCNHDRLPDGPSLLLDKPPII